ncbi:MAG TPA: T9SS type A sorting domain-containing protein [Bacteroidales bacterium]|nr:T9SS type A sorting domain-containing protein [Bacteroidales bacterium]HPS17489.1 T9SS type A sorting domain-containing protein [Bacteroidales bacterium]
MKKIFTILCLAVMPFLTSNSFAQDTLAAWTFPSTSADSLVDVAPSLNSSRYISCQYGTWGATTYHAITTDYTTNGSLGSPDKCAKATGWNDGADSAYWMIKLKTTGYGNLKLYSKQQGGGSNPGPRDFKVQYKLPGSTSPWVDLTTVTCANDWTTGVVNGITIPSACDNQSSQISIRWLVSSNIDINGGTVLSTGISKIDDIIITGVVSTGIAETENESLIKVYPNPSNGNFFIENNGEINKIAVYNLLGKCVYSKENVIEYKTELSGFVPGMYMVQLTSTSENVYTYKIIVE